jgi:UDP-N-acetylmuramate dehydrogenase
MQKLRVSLKEYSSFRVGGEGDLIVIENEGELEKVVKDAAAEGRRIHMLGEGTNSIFAEDLSKYLFIQLKTKGIHVDDMGDTVVLAAEAGENWDDVVACAVEKNLAGIENLSYIPGSVGAAPVQNIGAYGLELKDTLEEVRVYDTRAHTFISLTNKDCAFGYRDSIFKHEPGRYIILAVTLRLRKAFTPILTYKPLDALISKENLTLGDVRNEVIRIRTEKLPNYHEYPNCGSFFKNQVISRSEGERLQTLFPNIVLHAQGNGYKVPTAWLIEHVAEMKGVRIGSIGTWPKQPLVLVHYGEGVLEDVEAFAQTIIDRVREKTGITLEREVNFIR